MLENENINEPQNPVFLVGAVSSPLRLVSAIKEIENAMERWHHARDNDGETLQNINDILVDIGLLGWFNKQ